jgi:Uma2 family endonuclease
MSKPLLTRAAEGLDRWGWTNAQIQDLVRAGVLDEDAPMELIRGEIVPMMAEMNPHFKMRTRLWRHFTLSIEHNPPPGSKLIVASEASLFLFDDTEFKPDVAIFPEDMSSDLVRGPDVLLAIEVASSSHRRDRIIKPPLYAESELRELWVVDLDKRQTIVHRGPEARCYSKTQAFAFEVELTPLALPTTPVRIAGFL